MGRDGRTTRELTYWVAVIAALLIAGSLLVGSLLTGGPPAHVAPPASPSSLVRTTPRLATLARSTPVRLSIAALGVSTSVGTVGLQCNHQVMAPTNTTSVSWFRLGPTPGQIGSSVILGHVDSRTGPGVFFNLKLLRPGSAVRVVLADGVTARFAVIRVAQYSKSSFPDHLVYGAHGTRLLNLVTCGGVFDHATGHYESNIVVFTRLVGSVRPSTSSS